MSIHGWSMDATVTTDTLTEEAGEGVGPWMVHGWSDYVSSQGGHSWMVHGYNSFGWYPKFLYSYLYG